MSVHNRFPPAPGGKQADDVPFGFAQLEGLAHVEAGELPRCGHARDYFIASAFKHPPLRDLHVAAHSGGCGFDAAKGDVGVGAGGALGHIDDHEQFRGSHRGAILPRHTGSVFDDPGFLPPDTAGHLVVGPVAQDNGDVVPPGGRDRAPEPLGDGQDADENGHDTGDAEDGGDGGTLALGNRAEPEPRDGGNLRNQLIIGSSSRRNASARPRRIA